MRSTTSMTIRPGTGYRISAERWAEIKNIPRGSGPTPLNKAVFPATDNSKFSPLYPETREGRGSFADERADEVVTASALPSINTSITL